MDENVPKYLTVNELELIQLAYQEFMSKGINTSTYNITVLPRAAETIVIFYTKKAAPHTRGTTDSSPSFEVIIDTQEKRILRSYFVR